MRRGGRGYEIQIDRGETEREIRMGRLGRWREIERKREAGGAEEI